VIDPIAFLGVSLLVIVTPGQDTALTIRNTLLGGRRGGVATALGVVAGQLCWALATSLGLAAVLLAWQPAFVALKLAGAAYLMFLGAQALLAALSRPLSRPGRHRLPRPGRHRRRAHHTTTADRPGQPAAAALRQGVLSNLGNPKNHGPVAARRGVRRADPVLAVLLRGAGGQGRGGAAPAEGTAHP